MTDLELIHSLKVDVVKILMLDQGLIRKDQFYQFYPTENDMQRYFPSSPVHLCRGTKEEKKN